MVQDWFFLPGEREGVTIELARLLPGFEVITSFMEPACRFQLRAHPIGGPKFAKP